MAERKPVVLVSGQLKELPAGDTLPPQTPATHSHATSDVTGLDAALAGKEPTISAGTTAQYWRGNKAWRDFFTDVRAATLTGLSTATNAVITATDTVLTMAGKLQKQFSDHFASTANAHPASAINVAAADPPTSYSIPAGTVQGLLAANWQDVGGLMDWRDFHASGAGTQHPASTISNTPAGGISATTVQAAIDELDTEKFNKTGGSISGGISVAGNVLATSGTIGYGVGAGGTVVQATSKSTSVTLNKPSGLITLNASPLAAGATTTFAFNNSFIADVDTVVVSFFGSVASVQNKYSIRVSTETGAASITLKNETAGELSEAVAFTFKVFKGATS